MDRLGAVQLLALPSLAAATGLAFLLRPEPLFAYLFFAGLGLGFGCSGAITTAAWAEMFGRESIGTIRALSSSFAIFLTAAAPATFGLLLNRGVATEAILFCSVLLVLGLSWPLTLWLRHANRRARSL